MENRAGRFLDAFSRIERRLRALAGQPRGDTFLSLARVASSRDHSVQRYFNDLRELADLRNAIVHDRRGGEPIAEPLPVVVDLIERIAEQLENPPRVSALQRHAVVVCAPGDPIERAARLMLDHDFAQVPIYEGSQWRGLLTAETIARWLAHRFQEGDDRLRDEPISTVLGFRDGSSAELFVSNETPLMDVIDAFHRHTQAGRTLDAVIVTQDGRADQRPISIFTVFDLPTMYRTLALDRGEAQPAPEPPAPEAADGAPAPRRTSRGRRGAAKGRGR